MKIANYRILIIISALSLAAFGQSAVTSKAESSATTDASLQAPLPPDGFDALHATDAELARYALPPRPADPKQLQSWQYAMGHVKHFIRPQFVQAQSHFGSTFGDNIWGGL